ncbi:MAG: type 1 glutamine amidotransferase, partial [Gammaproteobacteria bacterium]|nr:type 1 glutamine amidotransferase [Gammaproteobacteria bacterium]
MKIGILQCDHVNELFREQFDDYPEMFINLLSAVAPQLEFEVFSLIDGEFPESLDSCDAWLITGSRHGTYEDLPWIHRLGELIRQLDADKRKVVGICFGHQMIAQALGGESGKSDKGWG